MLENPTPEEREQRQDFVLKIAFAMSALAGLLRDTNQGGVDISYYSVEVCSLNAGCLLFGNSWNEGWGNACWAWPHAQCNGCRTCLWICLAALTVRLRERRNGWRWRKTHWLSAVAPVRRTWLLGGSKVMPDARNAPCGNILHPHEWQPHGAAFSILQWLSHSREANSFDGCRRPGICGQRGHSGSARILVEHNSVWQIRSGERHVTKICERILPVGPVRLKSGGCALSCRICTRRRNLRLGACTSRLPS